MEQFFVNIEVDPAGSRQRAHVVLWDGRTLEAFADTPDAAAGALALQLREEMRRFVPDIRFQFLSKAPEELGKASGENQSPD